MSSFGERLIEARKRQHLTQFELAKSAGVTRSGISGYETEGKFASYDVLIRLARALGVSTDYLVGADNSTGWQKRAHVAETLYNLELLYDRADAPQKAALDALLDEVDDFLTPLFTRPDMSNLSAAGDLLQAARRMMERGEDGEQQ